MLLDTQTQLTKINVFPVKSVGGISLSNALVEKQGLEFDRRFMVAFPDGRMVTARKFPQLVTLGVTLTANGLRFSSPEHPPLTIRYDEFAMQPKEATVWKDTFEAYSTTEAANAWFSAVIDTDVQLLFTGEQSQRVRESVGHNVSFADGYPLLVISQASLDELNRRSTVEHSMEQFRTNLVVDVSEPFEEDSWKRIRIGEVEFEVVKPCERCVLTTVDVKEGKLRKNREPLKTFAKFRANEKGRVFFGQNLVAINQGVIRTGDTVEVLEFKEKERYSDKQA